MTNNEILIADDDASIRTVLTQALSRAGYSPRATSNAATLWRWATRMLHQWGWSKRRRQLDALASRIAEGMTD